MSKDHSYSHNDALLCPHCGHEQEDLFELSGAYDEGDHDHDCYHCGVEFTFSTIVSYAYGAKTQAHMDARKEADVLFRKKGIDAYEARMEALGQEPWA